MIAGREETAKLLLEARKINTESTDLYLERLSKFSEKLFDKKLKNLEILFLGCTYKIDVDDLRGSPALKIINSAANIYKKVYVIEPMVKVTNLEELNKNVEFIEIDALSKIHSIDIICPLIMHSVFKRYSKQLTDCCELVYDPFKVLNYN
ncbi:hypothetical protein OAW67_00870 [Planktomarina sp.]|nr:hypothetical protein [Planktomarina sp.]